MFQDHGMTNRSVTMYSIGSDTHIYEQNIIEFERYRNICRIWSTRVENLTPSYIHEHETFLLDCLVMV